MVTDNEFDSLGELVASGFTAINTGLSGLLRRVEAIERRLDQQEEDAYYEAMGDDL